MIKLNQPEPTTLNRKQLYKELAKINKEIVDLYHNQIDKKITADKYRDDNLILFERKRRLIADISLTYPDRGTLWLD